MAFAAPRPVRGGPPNIGRDAEEEHVGEIPARGGWDAGRLGVFLTVWVKIRRMMGAGKGGIVAWSVRTR